MANVKPMLKIVGAVATAALAVINAKESIDESKNAITAATEQIKNKK